MSSIYGKLNFNQRPVDNSDVVAMENALNHWNADDKHVWHEGCVGLGHLMLYNTPESIHEKLPLHDSDNRLTITADARIDNRDELFNKLDLPSQPALSVPDSTLILKAYQKYGEDCVQHLIGDFAFAIWDEKEQKLFCARDQMGVKPFFYYEDEYIFAFASEKKGILCLDGINKDINKQFFYNYLVWPPLETDDITLYEKINRLKPAHTLTVYAGAQKRMRSNRYWDLDTETETKFLRKQDYYEGLAFHFDQAVKCRVRTAYPIGAELSGGLDSSAITGAAHQFLTQNGQQIITFSNTLPEGVTDEKLSGRDERRFMDDVIRFNGIDNFVYVTERVFNNALDEIDFLLKVDDGLEYYNPLWQLPCRRAALQKGVRTMLSGFPGDQMVTSFNKTYFLDLFHKKQYVEYFRAEQKYPPRFNKFRPFMPAALVSTALKIKDGLGFYGESLKAALAIYNIPVPFQKSMSDYMREGRRNQFLKNYRLGQKGILMQPLVYNRMESETRHGIYFKLEPRFPMADIRLIQFYSAMPNEIKYEGAIGRNAYREAVKKYLPDTVLQRKDKFGSIAPFLSLNNNNLAHLERLLNKTPFDHFLIKKNEVMKRLHGLKESGHHKTEMKELLKNNLPALNLLRWLEHNEDLVKNFR